MTDTYADEIEFKREGSLLKGYFKAMACPCVIMLEHEDLSKSPQFFENEIRLMADEVWRIERKYSRYSNNSTLSEINNSAGVDVLIDSETYQLLHVADVLWEESEGMFDISSGVFRKIWSFKNQENIPSPQAIKEVLSFVGWQKIKFDQNKVCLGKGMQIDFGGIGKEYAADRCSAAADPIIGNSILVNLGGDVVAKGPRISGDPWGVVIESKEASGHAWKMVPLFDGAIATSGDIYKHIFYDGKRYSHIINALTGYPSLNSPNSITIAAPNCTEAGMLSTVAMLKGNNAEEFLQEHGRPYWIQK